MVWRRCLVFLSLGLGACESAPDVARSIAMTSPEYASAVAAGQAASGLMTLFERDKSVGSQAELRERMHQQAGREHFQNEALIEAQQKLRPPDGGFTAFRNKMGNSRFQQTRASFQSSEGVSSSGSLADLLGVTKGSPSGALPAASQPLLGNLLPAFKK